MINRFLQNHFCEVSLLFFIFFASCRKNELVTNPILNVTISNPETTTWLGFGYNQDPLDRNTDGHDIGIWDNARWNLTMERVNFIKPSLVRIVLYRFWFNPSGVVGNYDWNSPFMLSLYKVLDYYKDKNSR